MSKRSSSKKGSCQCPSKDLVKQSGDWLDKFQDFLLRGTYVFCSCLLVYSLLLVNSLAASGDFNTKEFLAKATIDQPIVKNLAADLKQSNRITISFMNEKADSSLNKNVQYLSRAIGKSCEFSGKILAQVAEVMTAPPPFARAMSGP